MGGSGQESGNKERETGDRTEEINRAGPVRASSIQHPATSPRPQATSTMSDQAHQLRQLVRTAVQLNPALHPLPRIVAVSGASRGGPTSVVACQTAHELAQLGQRVLLIDADMTTPGIARHLSAAGDGSIADVLSGTRRLVEVIQSLTARISILAALPDEPPLAPLDRDTRGPPSAGCGNWLRTPTPSTSC